MELVFENTADFQLTHIFDCGQCFRWNKEPDGSYTGVVMDKVVNAAFFPDEQDMYHGTLVLDNACEEDRFFWKDYFDLDRNYGAIQKALGQKDKVIREAMEQGKGIRILRQDPWETLISFIISQNNNIPRIKRGIESICSNFGSPTGIYREKEVYGVPGPEVLARLSVEDLSVCKLGYRAKYIIHTAKKVLEDGREKLNSMANLEETSFEEAFSYLSQFCGVGPKVANCILLFSMNRFSSFPVDVWMTRVMEELYGLSDKEKILSFVEERFGEFGGIAQQYLFYYIRQRHGNL